LVRIIKTRIQQQYQWDLADALSANPMFAGFDRHSHLIMAGLDPAIHVIERFMKSRRRPRQARA
jgi:hypothetical protein